MKIALVGTHSSGKTTLANALSKELGLPIASLTPESVFKEFNSIEPECTYAGFPGLPKNGLKIIDLLESLEHDEQLSFSKAAFRAQASVEALGGHNYIADNSLVQQLGLMLYYASFGVEQYKFQTLYTSCLELAKSTYGFVFLLPYPSAIELDGIRPDNAYAVMAIDYVLQGVVADFKNQSPGSVVSVLKYGSKSWVEDVSRAIWP